MTFSVSDEVLIGTTLFLGAVAIFGPTFADSFKLMFLRQSTQNQRVKDSVVHREE